MGRILPPPQLLYATATADRQAGQMQDLFPELRRIIQRKDVAALDMVFYSWEIDVLRNLGLIGGKARTRILLEPRGAVNKSCVSELQAAAFQSEGLISLRQFPALQGATREVAHYKLLIITLQGGSKLAVFGPSSLTHEGTSSEDAGANGELCLALDVSSPQFSAINSLFEDLWSQGTPDVRPGTFTGAPGLGANQKSANNASRQAGESQPPVRGPAPVSRYEAMRERIRNEKANKVKQTQGSGATLGLSLTIGIVLMMAGGVFGYMKWREWDERGKPKETKPESETKHTDQQPEDEAREESAKKANASNSGEPSEARKRAEEGTGQLLPKMAPPAKQEDTTKDPLREPQEQRSATLEAASPRLVQAKEQKRPAIAQEASGFPKAPESVPAPPPIEPPVAKAEPERKEKVIVRDAPEEKRIGTEAPFDRRSPMKGNEFILPNQNIEVLSPNRKGILTEADNATAAGGNRNGSPRAFPGTSGGEVQGSFGQRSASSRQLMVTRHGGSLATEGALELALKWMANHQEADGHWDSRKHFAISKADTVCTGFALLAFLGAGHSEKVGQYKDNIIRAVTWLKSKQQANGLVLDQFDAEELALVLHPHAIAGLALAEAAGMAHVPETVAAAQKAVDYSENVHQQTQGGWGYAPQSEPNIYITSWFILQLKSAMVARLSVNQGSFERAIKFLNSVEVEESDAGGSDGHRYRPQPGKREGLIATAFGCFARQLMGWRKEDLQGGVEWFVQQMGGPEWDPNKGSMNFSYWHFGTLCAFQQGGEVWKAWNDSMKKALVDNQQRGGNEDGSWDPVGKHSGEWGRVGQTALGCLCLEVYYRYLPMYKD